MADPSHAPLPISQAHGAPGVIDLALGHPGPELLPVDLVAEASRSVLSRYGPDALAYGADAGPGPFLEWLSDALAAIDGRAPRPDELLVTAGASHALELVAGRLTQPGDVCLVPTPTYHLALRVLRDHPLRIVPVATDASGLTAAALAEAIERVRRDGHRPSLVYCIPTAANPTGVTVSVERRREIVAVCAAAGTRIVEDDVYRELWYDAPAPPSLWALAEPGAVIRLGSFSKTLAPGSRVGYLAANAATVEQLVNSGMFDSGGGIAHLGALMVSELGRSGAYAAHVLRLRAELAARRDALVAGLREHVPAATFAVPAGGYFLWVRLPGGLDARVLVADAARHGVGALPGPIFSVGDGADRDVVRLSFSRYPPDQLAEAAKRLAGAVGAALAGR